MTTMADQLTRSEVEEALAAHRLADRNVIRVVGSIAHPSEWDTRSARYDRLLTEWEAAKDAGTCPA